MKPDEIVQGQRAAEQIPLHRLASGLPEHLKCVRVLHALGDDRCEVTLEHHGLEHVEARQRAGGLRSTALRDLIDGGTGAGRLVYYAELTLGSEVYFDIGTAIFAEPCGVVTDGVLSLDVATQATANSDGHLAYAEVTNSEGRVHITLPIVESMSPVADALAVPLRQVVTGTPLHLLSLTIDLP